jgi:probable rRNA maturation factor
MKELQLRNRQRERRLDTGLLRRIARALLEEELGIEQYELAIHLLSAPKMAQLNERFLEHSGSTDVITFDYRDGYTEDIARGAELAGEIYISVTDALRQAHEFSTTWQEEIARYMIHGVLHLRGYDDASAAKRRVMKREENRLTRRIGKRFPISQIAA